MDIVPHDTEVITMVNNHPRVSSILIASKLNVEHRNLFNNLLLKYETSLKSLGELFFKKTTEELETSKYALLNEDQSYLLLTLVRNSKYSVPLKLELVKAFKLARGTKQPQDELEVLEVAIKVIKETRNRVDALEERLDNTPVEIDGKKSGHLHNLLNSYGRRIGNYTKGYSTFKKIYNIGSYKQLPLRLYDEAIQLVMGWHKTLDEEEKSKLNFYD